MSGGCGWSPVGAGEAPAPTRTVAAWAGGGGGGSEAPPSTRAPQLHGGGPWGEVGPVPSHPWPDPRTPQPTLSRLPSFTLFTCHLCIYSPLNHFLPPRLEDDVGLQLQLEEETAKWFPVGAEGGWGGACVCVCLCVCFALHMCVCGGGGNGCCCASHAHVCMCRWVHGRHRAAAARRRGPRLRFGRSHVHNCHPRRPTRRAT